MCCQLIGTGLVPRLYQSAEQDRPQYLAFVDGLRAISIVAVVAFHVGLPGFSGGFVGVDVFFVISGFLIITQIRTELERGRFSLAAFYSRRCLRILPPFLAMIAFVLVAAPLVLPSPDVYYDFALAAVLAPLMASNVLFFLRQGYFDLAADEKPLLHTWTLSVEEQFYFVAPLLLLLAFRLGGKRFGWGTIAFAAILGIGSLLGAIMGTTTSGRNPAFYLAHWRAWEFVAGGLIAGPLVVAVGRAPRLIAEAIGIAGLAAILVAICWLDAKTAYPSWRAVLPVAGAALTILAGLADPRIVVARILALPPMVVVGLVSYGWYLWHWPLLSLLRISRLGEHSLGPDLLLGGVVAFLVAWASYRVIELPVRRWRRSAGAIRQPTRIVLAGVAACFAVALAGGLSSLAGFAATRSFVAARYATEGKGVLDNGCRILTSSTIPQRCLEGNLGIVLGDSHADALFGSFARIFESHGIRLVSIARGGCSPILFAPSWRQANRRHGCSNLLGPFEQLLRRAEPPRAVVVDSSWADLRLLSAANLADLLAQFDPAHTRLLVIGPVPIFLKGSLDCVVLSDRYGDARDRCTRPRTAVETERAAAVAVLAPTAARFPNVRYIDPIDVFCDPSTCRPFAGDQVLYRDAGHVSPQGADHIHDAFAREFQWLFGGDDGRHDG